MCSAVFYKFKFNRTEHTTQRILWKPRLSGLGWLVGLVAGWLVGDGGGGVLACSRVGVGWW